MPHMSQLFNPGFTTNFDFPTKTPAFPGTVIHMPIAQTGELRSSTQVYPLWTIEYKMNFALGSEQQSSVYQYMLSFYLQMGGQLSDFFYEDPNDNYVSGAKFGTGDGTTTAFQLVRPIGAFNDIVQNLNGTPTIYIAGTASTALTVGATGIVTFTTAPASGAALSWTGKYFYRVRFADAKMSFEQMMNQLWSSKSIKLQTVIL